MRHYSSRLQQKAATSSNDVYGKLTLAQICSRQLHKHRKRYLQFRPKHI